MLLTVEEAAAAIHATVKVTAIYRAIREGRLTASRIGKRFYVSESDLRRFTKCRAPASPPASGKEAMAPGSSSTPVVSIGQAAAEKAADDLLNSLSETTSRPARRSDPDRLSRTK
ncbi:MAG: helix-turn-helix domain-containing protein [Amaricoccus sp.]